ncbi:hypothetical protein ACFUCV_12670 [Specibacter sp. NPDC057265]|uniref:hypothetical protein n=1 Tax=Specibacter sp. NPDC057265 TaxID=3346075 RepID=UPI00363715BA
MRQKKAWIISGGTVAVLLAASAVILPPLFNDEGDSQAAQTTAPAPTFSAVAPDPVKTYPPVSSFYQQAGPPAGSPQTPVDPQTVTIGNEPVGTQLSSSQVGLSLEATDLADPNLNADNQTMVQILRGLHQPVLRFGGNAVDRRFFWTSTGEAIPADYSGDKAHPVRSAGPEDLQRIMGMLEAADAYISLSVDLGHYNPERAADMAKYGAEIFGDRLVAITIGNEPNGFGDGDRRAGAYTVDQFAQEAEAYAAAMYKTAPNVPISGPGTYSANWADEWAGIPMQQKKVLTFHHYPLTGCTTGKAEDAPTMANLMSSTMNQEVVKYAKTFVDKGNAAGMPIWIPESGISACTGGNETTKTYASALWAADFALSTAQTGIGQADFHSSMITCQGGPPMSMVCADGAYLQPTGDMSVRANYYGISMVSSIGAGKFLQLSNEGGGLNQAYAIQKDDGSTTVVFINQNDPTQSAQTQVTLKLPNIPATATMTQMTGPSYGAEDGVAIDGAATAPVDNAQRPAPMNFKPGVQEQSFALTAGTVTVMNFTY